MSKRDSKIIYGVAILLMLLLHVAGGQLFETKSILLPDTMVTFW